MRLGVVALVIVSCCVAACTAGPAKPAPPTSTRVSLPPGTAELTCEDPIGVTATVPSPETAVLDAVAVDITSTLGPAAITGEPHRLFAKTGLLVHAGHPATLTVPGDWSGRVSIAWGNHAAQWATSLRIPPCSPPSGTGGWLAYPGGFSLDTPACVPLQVRAGDQVTTVHVAVGKPCPR